MGCKKVLIQNLMTFTVLLGIVLGVTIGWTMNVIHPDKYTKRELMYVRFPGELFMRMMTALSLPLIASCIVYSVGKTHIHLLKTLGYQFVIYILVTKFEVGLLAACLGMLFRPGETPETSVEHRVDTKVLLTLPDIFTNAVKNMCPKNLIEVTLRHYKTLLVNTQNDTIEDLDKWKIVQDGREIDHPNVLGIVSLSVTMGLTLNLIEQEGQYMLSLVKCLMKATMLIVIWVMWLAPIGTVFIIAQRIIRRDATIQYLTEMSTFISVYFTVLTVQMIVYSLTYLVFVRKNPLKFFWNISESLVLSVASGKSYVALPYTILSLRRKLHIDNRITNFVMPIGTYLNKDGTTVFLVLGVMFISKLNNIPMGLGKLCYVILLSVMATMDSSGVPGSALAMLNAILLSCDIPATGMHKLIALEWICARYRAMINTCGDAVAVCVLNQINRRLIKKYPDTDIPPEEEVT